MRLRIDTSIHFNPYRLIPLLLVVLPAANERMDRVLSRYIPQEQVKVHAISSSKTYLEIGDEIAGFQVSSGYGSRVAPCEGCSSWHPAIDIATPVGTEMKAPKNISVQCWWDDGGGGNVAEVTIDGDTIQLLHLETCVDGQYKQGEAFALTGNTGNGTGAHLDVRWADRREPVLEDIEPFFTGKPVKQPAISTAGLLTDEELTCAIGNAEGTKGDDCNPNPAYFGHIDPGNGASNIGTFSYQHGASSPEEADAKQIERLRNAESIIQQKAVDKFGQPLSKAALASALDLWNQAPLAGDDFVKHLTTADPSPQEIIDARSQAFINPATGQLEAPGLGNTWGGVKHDQKRRTDELLPHLE